MRIGIVGINGETKTRLAILLAEALNLPPITGIEDNEARLLRANDTADTALAVKHRIQVLSRLIGEEERLGRFVTDLTVLDCLARWKSGGLSSYDPGAGKAHEATCLGRAGRYDLLVYVPGDGVEDAILKELLGKWCRNVPVVVVSGSSENKVRQVLSFLRGTKGAAAL